MRIIAGEHRGRRIEAPRGRSTRPMLDRVREALFSTLGERVDDARVLDLFAGSGSLGLEALSRGARSARLIDRGAEALRALKANIETLRLEERVEVVRGDALEPQLWTTADLVFLDPPYALMEDEPGRARILERIDELLRDVLPPEGLLVLHTEKRVAFGLQDEHDDWDLRLYGSSALIYIHGREGA